MALADEPTQQGLLSRNAASSQSAPDAGSTGVQSLLDKGLSFLGIKYRFGGNGPENGGFDCSGLVRRVFGDAMGLNLPRTAADMAKLGDKVNRNELKPGDLVFFNTMRRSFSHVGIYLGDNRFLHAPSKGSVVRVEEIDGRYWQKRFNGARRLLPEANAAVVNAINPAITAAQKQQGLTPSAAAALSQSPLLQSYMNNPPSDGKPQN
ncbi:C40 family peptidase [Uliginosibacterium sp. sgz301328]|uniref:C40 family peptidase n=1 Tax=Uliginosibacterium sp. sgz301328 TaxID=3243764 RepID=UPI00359D1890